MFNNVVFPAPLAPIIAVHVPALNIPLMFFRIYFFLYVFLQGITLDCASSNISTEYEIFWKVISTPCGLSILDVRLIILLSK